MKSKQFNGINYTRFGKGPTVVFIHGFLESLNMWSYLPLEQLQIDCILVDLPGHGKSVLKDENAPSMEFYVQELQALIEFLGVEDLRVVGHSMGGYVGTLWISQNSAIKKMIYLNSHFWEDSPEKKMDRISVSELVYHAKSLFLKTAIPNLFPRPEEQQDAIKAIISEAETFEARGVSYAALAMGQRRDFAEYVNQNPEKFSMILGADDGIVPIDLIFQAVNTAVEIEVIENCGHMAHIEKSGQVLNLLRKQLVD